MSLKAYDGMMSRKNIKYIQDEIVKRLDRFRKASEDHITKRYGEIFIDYFDKGISIIKEIEFESINDAEAKDRISKIKIEDDTTILSYIFQASKILSEGYFVNDFMVHLNLSIQAINNRKILIYPNIIVKEHKAILLEFLEDWYCQNGSDADDDVKIKTWKQREKDWYNFDEVQGFSMKIQLFDPNHYWNSLVKNFRGKELIDGILKHIPSDEDRIRKIAKDIVINKKIEESTAKDKKLSFYDVIKILEKDNNTEIDDYIKNNVIEITKIDADVITNTKLK